MTFTYSSTMMGGKSDLCDRLFRLRRTIFLLVFLVFVLMLVFPVNMVYSTVLFFTHAPTHAPRAITMQMYEESTRDGVDKRPMYILNGSAERWKSFEVPAGVEAHRVSPDESTFGEYTRYIDTTSSEFAISYGPGVQKVAAGHFYIWTLIEQDPACQKALCLVSEDDASYPDVPVTDDENNIAYRPWDPRPLLDIDDAKNLDLVFLYNQWAINDKRLKFRKTEVGKENIMYVTWGAFTVSYALTAGAATKLLEPFRSRGLKLDVPIDLYLIGRTSSYWHDVDTYVMLYDGWSPIHKSTKSLKGANR